MEATLKSMSVAGVPPHWNGMAAVWNLVGPPLRPSAEDQQLYWNLIDPWIQNYPRPRVLILGVTPELYHLPWPANCELRAIDRAREMIDNFWPGARKQVIEADWLALPLPNESLDLAVCDGGLILLDPASQRRLVERLHHVIAPGGRCVFRLFVPALNSETPNEILADLFAGRVPDLNVLKLRLSPAVRDPVEGGSAVYDVWKTLRAAAGDWETLAARIGWRLNDLRVIDAYYESTARYYYRSQSEIESLFGADGKFSFLGARRGEYFCAERCPLVAFERR